MKSLQPNNQDVQNMNTIESWKSKKKFISHIALRKKYDERQELYDRPKHAELPENSQYVLNYLQKNDIHGFDESKSSSIEKNMKFNLKINKSNPHFNKVLAKEPQTDYLRSELYSMNQLTNPLAPVEVKKEQTNK